MNTEIKDMILQTSLFENINASELDRIIRCSHARLRTYHTGELIFQQDEAPMNLFLLLKGEIQISTLFESGKKTTFFHIKSGDIFGESNLRQITPNYLYDAEACTDCITMEIPWNFFHGFCHSACEHHRQIICNMLKVLSEKEGQIFKKLQIYSLNSLREKISLWLTQYADDNNVVQTTGGRDQLAEYLGVTRPSLSRELMRMQADGLIKVERNKISIIDKSLLKNLCK